MFGKTAVTQVCMTSVGDSPTSLVGNLYNLTDVLAPMMPVYQQLIKSGAKLNILVYSGDDDAVCATLGSQQ